ncbi:hypothetical protein TWF106_000358 [Orbilia oligospora]|uniref:Uncharacterized protein n=1 Tax=Orbilia oligospora TaxID=2813651 RepID=A0A6G1MKR1_ORBOL|nr:hypothetical protein TWF788_003860 [Orbilia oligospora]KAF3203402.1 hypothetical protein TWF679_010270 [Orbilia oligospora]KAF3210684.1 hypothetical protein TWF191_011163 [Orbilia oligospora]KAF3226618.1 hypothetical protein TWF106_000358 [Orbilia oligospora]KAF3261130.1 hypothetical protein TWF192_009062 [Orbilia oligospora]
MVSKWVKLGVWVLTHPWRCLHVSFANGIWENTTEDPYKIDTWVKAKKKELAEAGICATVVGAAITASIQWNQTYDTHWSVLGFWYGALLLSLLSVTTSFHLGIYLSSIPLRAPDWSYRSAIAGDTKLGRYISLWILQASTQLLSYSIISYVLGLSVMIISKLWEGPWGDDSKVCRAEFQRWKLPSRLTPFP